MGKLRDLINVIIQNTAVSIGSEINDHLVGITSLDALVGLAQVLKELKQVDSVRKSDFLWIIYLGGIFTEIS